MPLFKRKLRDEIDDSLEELEELREEVKKAHLPSHAESVALREIERLSRISPNSAEYTIGINYLDYLLSLPWNTLTEDNTDLKRAEKILNQDHYGLQEVKDRILEYLAVRTLKMKKRHGILVVDDEKPTRENLRHIYEKEGYQVYTAENGEAALRILEQETIDVLITDLKMEQVDGFSLLEQARELDPTIVVIIITGYATIETAVEAIKKGSYHFLSKPLKLNELRKVTHEAIKQSRSLFSQRGPIMGFVGPPGTGKTSLGRSIARSLERKFIRLSLAGMKDEAEIRGHRRSYVGALPARIIQEIRRSGSRNLVFMLDEIDKVGQDFRGDPAAALLEVLDPEQNKTFIDYYLDVPFDLSRIMFITTANSMDNIPPALLDRLELIRIAGYTENEKENIARQYLIPREIENAGLSPTAIHFEEEAVREIIRNYTREAGVRNLQRNIAAICRKTARKLLSSNTELATQTITKENLSQYLGPPGYFHEKADEKDLVGVATGLAWTESGGELIFVEAIAMPGKNRLILTGSLGDIMKESARAALSFIQSRHAALKIDPDFFENHDIHIHVPAGAIPKDGALCRSHYRRRPLFSVEK